jgi:replicative DNA helicase
MKVGKTIFLGSISYNLNEMDIPHLWIACEMSSVELEQRHLARSLKINGLSFLKNGNNEDLQRNIIRYMGNGFKTNITYLDAPCIRVDDMLDAIDSAVETYGIRGFILDYLQLVYGMSSDNRTDHIEYVAQQLAGKVREHGIWGIVAAQLNQEGNTRNGEGLKLACDQLYTIHRPVHSYYSWLEMNLSRYTPIGDVGSESVPSYELDEFGPHFTPLNSPQHQMGNHLSVVKNSKIVRDFRS